MIKRAARTARLSVLLAVLLLFLSLPARADVPTVYHSRVENLPLTVDGGAAQIVKALHYSYINNRYVSLRDMAAALSSTPKAFALTISGEQLDIVPGGYYMAAGGEGLPFPEYTPTGAPYVLATRPLALNPMQLEDRAVRYLTFLGSNPAGASDCFMSLTDLAMLLDLDVELSDGVMRIDSSQGFRIDLEALAEQGFYHEVHAALVGDATDGTVFAAWNPMLSVPIASTSKLMTFLCVMDAAAEGVISLDDTVVVPPEAAALSRTQDGMIALEAGWETTVPDLLCGMLLPSSNECALTLAVHTDGSEAAFVERMNRTAARLGLSDATVFYNCNGLPQYTDNLAATKVQNRMSVRDMFTLVRHLLNTYPVLTQITSRTMIELSSLHTTVMNTNPLLFNVPGCVGLKTGTTNMSGVCLVSAAEVQDAQDRTHVIVAMEYGAEDGTIRTTISEELLRYGIQCLREGYEPDARTPEDLPDTAEELIRLILNSR